MLFDFFYFISGRFPTTTAHAFIPGLDLPMEVNEEEINIKKLYEKFRRTNSHGLVSSQVFAGLNIFFGSDPEITDLISRINIMLRGLGNNKKETIKKEDDDTVFKIKTKYEIDEDLPPPYLFDTIEDELNTEPENIKETDIVEPKL